MPHEEKIEWVSPKIIRQYFNKSGLLKKIQSGELVPRLKRDGHPVIPSEPYCTRSQIVYYYDAEGSLVTVVHQYLRDDGTIGGKGKPDPKKLYLQDRILAVRSRPSNK